MLDSTNIALAPQLPWWLLGPLLSAMFLTIGLAAIRGARGWLWRSLVAATLAIVLLNPSLVREEREPIEDVAVIVVDQSPSHEIGERAARAEAALARLREDLEQFDDLDLRIVRSGGDQDASIERTRLFESLDAALIDVPRRRMAGTILLTDGQVHDVPENEATLTEFGPVHTLLTGRRDEADRRLVIDRAPSFGLVGQSVNVTVMVEDLPGQGGGGLTSLSIRRDGGEPMVLDVPIGIAQDLTLPIEHGGPTVFELEVAPATEELALANNRAAVVINGVRDRLRVLLVSGEPHPGERTWRTILKSDPSVDLVHFTILRPPEKQDGTPINELSLISFPIRELFELRLNEFDLIIFDRYRRRGVLPSLYLGNIANYVRSGGAFLEASGPQFASTFSLYRTPLGEVLPGEPTGRVLEEGFRPDLTDLGLRHPVTSELLDTSGPAGDRASPPEPAWGRWFRQVDVASSSGATVMKGLDGRPLLILDRVGDGRVAQLMSDHIWLWSRNFEGGGPQAELLRRLAHWLMKEPELEESDLKAEVDGREVRVERRSLQDASGEVRVESPSGAVRTLHLNETSPGRAEAVFSAEEPGIFRIIGADRTALAVVGTPNPPELSDLRTTPDRLRPVADATKGSVRWLEQDGTPRVRRVRPDREAAGRGWIGLRMNGDYNVAGIREDSLVPPALVLLLVVGGLIAAWRREGR